MHASDVRGRVVHAGYGTRAGIPGGYNGWVIRGPVHYPATLLEEGTPYSGAGPVGPAGAGVGGTGWTDVPAAGDGFLDHPPGPVGAPGPSLSRNPQNAASWPITARLHLFSIKHCQNGQVSLKSVEKAYHSPCSQNELKKSALEILRFPFYPAFSPKELMGHFRPGYGH